MLTQIAIEIRIDKGYQIDINNNFPIEQSEVENFFYITGLEQRKQGNYRIRMKAATTERPFEIQKRMKQYLIRRNMFIMDPEIENSTWNVVVSCSECQTIINIDRSTKIC